jgi:hypothetical protein
MTEDHGAALSRRSMLAAAALGGAMAAAEPAAAAKGAASAGGRPMGPSNFGKSPGDEDLREAWKQFCRRLEQAGERVFKASSPANPLQRADGFRFLTQNLGQAFDLAYETKDTKYPVIFTFCTPLCKLGGDNADCIYQQAWIDGESVYKISGNVGSVKMLNFTVQGPKPALQPGTNWPSLPEPFGDIPEANITAKDMTLGWDGSFELYVGGPRRGPNWVPTTPGSRKLFIRQVFDDFDEEPGRFRIERVGMTTPRPLPLPGDMVTAMDWAGRFLDDTMAAFPDDSYKYNTAHYADYINQFPPQLGSDPATDKLRGRAPTNMTWSLHPDEAIVIEFADHAGFWMFTNMGEFWNSMDYLYRPVSYTPSRSTIDPDGVARFVMCAEDPGYHNWIDTQGFARGQILYRRFGAGGLPDLKTKVVKRDQLASAMHPGAARSTPEERVAQLQKRFRSIIRRYGV